MSKYDELIASLREYAEYIGPNNYELPIMMYDHLTQAADVIEELSRGEKEKPESVNLNLTKTVKSRTDKRIETQKILKISAPNG